MKKPRALAICPEAPYPMYGGGAIRTASVLAYLARNHDVDAIFFHEFGEPNPAAGIPPGLLRDSLTLTLPRHSRANWARAVRNARRLWQAVVPLCDRFDGFAPQIGAWLQGREYDLAVLEHFWVAGYGPLIKKHARRVVLDLHNVESCLLARTAASMAVPASWALRRFARIGARYESAWLPAFDSIWVASEDDARVTPVQNAGVPICVYPNALPPARPPRVDRDSSIAFSGNWGYGPNQSGLRWFLDQSWPRIRRRHPHFKLRLVGRGSAELGQALGPSSAIEWTGVVDDALLWLARAQVAIAPLLIGSGTRVKILEAWAASTPVVATSIAAEGLEAIPGQHLMISDSPEGFADAVTNLLESPGSAEKLATSARFLYESRYSWEAAWESLARAGF